MTLDSANTDGQIAAALRSGLPVAGDGGFWRRLAAWIIDAWLMLVGIQVIDLVVGLLSNGRAAVVADLLDAVLVFGYFTYLWGARGQTLGYMLLGLRLGRSDAGPVGYVRAFCRILLVLISCALCLVPAIVSAFTVALAPRKRALHDLILGTRVLRV